MPSPALQSPAEFQQRLRLAKEADQLVLVVCFAPWCAACKALHPKVQQLAERNPTVTFLEVGTAAGQNAVHAPLLDQMCTGSRISRLLAPCCNCLDESAWGAL